MSQAKSKYDYPGLPLRDRDGNPVGVGDRLSAIDGGSFPSMWITEFEGDVGFVMTGFNSVFPISRMAPNAMKDWSLVMPPGFPKDRRIDPSAPVYRFVDEWHAVRLGDGHAFKVSIRCGNIRYWTHDGDGNPVRPETVEPDSTQAEKPGPAEIKAALHEWVYDRIEDLEDTMEAHGKRLVELERSQRDLNRELSAELDARCSGDLARRVEALEKAMAGLGADHPLPAEEAAEQWQTSTAKRNADQFRASTSPIMDAMKRGHVDEAAAARERVSGYDAQKRADLLRDAKAVQADPDQLPTDPDEELRDWFWRNARRIDMGNWKDCCELYWLDGEYCEHSGIQTSAPTFTEALRSIREQVEAQENGGAE